VGLVVHSPDLFRGDHILNLAEADDAYRRRSIHELQRVVDLTRQLGLHFPKAQRPLIVVSMGGFTSELHVPATERPAMYDRVLDSLGRVDADGVELIAQTLPPYPWYLGGQLHCNLFVDPEDIAGFAAEGGYRLCLDVSHSKLACNSKSTSFSEFVEIVGPHVAHLHLVDAVGLDGEGLQIGEGEIDWPVLAAQLDRLAPSAGFIPEIWQGHKNDGEGFWIGLERLEQWF
jgi:sugar phosphate isomerase/epimerase